LKDRQIAQQVTGLTAQFALDVGFGAGNAPNSLVSRVRGGSKFENQEGDGQNSQCVGD
jgi:hypothetical protein